MRVKRKKIRLYVNDLRDSPPSKYGLKIAM
jgi:hypothetical protein